MAGSWGDQISATKIVICTCLHMMAIPLAHPNPSGRGCQKKGLGRSGGQASWVTDNDYIPSLLHLSFWGVMDTLISSHPAKQARCFRMPFPILSCSRITTGPWIFFTQNQKERMWLRWGFGWFCLAWLVDGLRMISCASDLGPTARQTAEQSTPTQSIYLHFQ